MVQLTLEVARAHTARTPAQPLPDAERAARGIARARIQPATRLASERTDSTRGLRRRQPKRLPQPLERDTLVTLSHGANPDPTCGRLRRQIPQELVVIRSLSGLLSLKIPETLK